MLLKKFTLQPNRSILQQQLTRMAKPGRTEPEAIDFYADVKKPYPEVIGTLRMAVVQYRYLRLCSPNHLHLISVTLSSSAPNVCICVVNAAGSSLVTER